MKPLLKHKNSLYTCLFILFWTTFGNPIVRPQQTNNSSTLNNSAAPSASSVTTGGTNINYQTNNAYSNENGFGPGIFCRTPTLYVGGNWGNSQLDTFDKVQNSGNTSSNVSANIGILYPFGSSILRDCRRLVEMIALDREVSSQLSMLRLCDQLKKEGLYVDPEKYPLLKPCATSPSPQTPVSTQTFNPIPQSGPATSPKKPLTTRS